MDLCRSAHGGRLAGVRGYGQYRPIARAAEIVATRWTLIIPLSRSLVA
jgi:hypothetical protein